MSFPDEQLKQVLLWTKFFPSFHHKISVGLRFGPVGGHIRSFSTNLLINATKGLERAAFSFDPQLLRDSAGGPGSSWKPASFFFRLWACSHETSCDSSAQNDPYECSLLQSGKLADNYDKNLCQTLKKSLKAVLLNIFILSALLVLLLICSITA